MKSMNIQLSALVAVLATLAGIAHPDNAFAQASAGGIDVAQQPLFTSSGQPPLNMLVMGKDHKIYYEAYNDASDLNGDGALDVGYKPATIDYFGYFNSNLCYTWSTDKFVPAAAASNKQCTNQWSGDFLNYLTTSRMDALRRVLFGGWRQVDSTTDTVLQGAFFPQDGHSWGKEYQSVARDGYNIANYAPLTAPDAGKYILFAVTTTTGIATSFTFPNYQAPMLRVLKNTDKRVWNWLSIEGPVAGNKCFTATNARVDCVSGGGDAPYPGHPNTRGEFDTLETTYAIVANRYGSGNLNTINCNSATCNPYNADQDNFMAIIEGRIRASTSTRYQFRVNGDDAIDFRLFSGTTTLATAGCYGGRGFGACANAEKSAIVSLAASTNYDFKFRQEEATGGEGYSLEWRTCTGTTEATCGAFAIVPSSNTNGIRVSATLTTYDLTPPIPGSTRDDYLVRVRSCPSSNAAFREPTCKAYPNGQYKPTGILHDYGETQRMYFGLISGTQYNNLEGGVLRRNVSDFASEIDPANGRFRTNVNGIVRSISEFRMIGGNYNGTTTDNLNSDTNWNWNNASGDCPAPNVSAPLNNGNCRMWGNPLAEMVYESMRYYAGAATPTTRFSTASGNGATEETAMGLSQETWKDPYKPVADGGGGFLACSRPFQTLISDINPSYDGDLPGSPFTGAVTTINGTPTSISGFSAATEGQAIWTGEFGAVSKSVFIGDVANSTDGAPTAKSASSFGNIRGLSPEEPTKGGTYFTASVARFARNNDLNTVTGSQAMSTYAIALASPLPRIRFPVGGGVITMLPFAKTASGTFGGGTRKPTNTIVDFYVEKIVNLPGQPFDATVNGGRASAIFRINYEDVEQGNDHDMDAIVRYQIVANADNTATVTLTSEYAAGSADQNMGFVMSGSTQDGVYLDVRDTDSTAGSFLPYALNTPNPVLPGGCGATTPPVACASQLPTTSVRTFTPSAAGATGGAIFLNDPLWYAAKYGAPDPDVPDADFDGVPDNYFLVTNAGTLRAQLDRAFSGIINNSNPTASVATSTPRYVPGATLAYEASYKSKDWAGDIKAYNLRSDATYNGVTPVWSASARMPLPGARNVYTSKPSAGAFTGIPFTSSGLDTAMKTRLQGTLDTTTYTTDDLIAYLKGDQSKELGATGCVSATACPYRVRSSKIGDILNSTPAVIGVTSFGYGSILRDVAPSAAADYPAYVDAKKTIFGATSDAPVLFVGSNDGMLHAFDGSAGANGGKELFAYIPNAVVGNLNQLVTPGYVHRYFVDGSPTVSDAYLGDWKSILLGSLGAGGRGVYALDISNPRNFDESDVLWEFNSTLDGDMGQFVGRPYMGLTESGDWVAAFGNGLNSDRQRAVLYVMDLATGAQIAKIDTGVGCPTTTAGCVEGPNGLATAVLVDNTGDGAAETIYAGDYLGNMWRFELNSGVWELGNGGQPIFKAADPTGKPQSITSGSYTVANPLGGTMLIFGTGRYLNPDDADETRLGLGTRASLETIYGIWDSRAYDDVNDTWTTFFPIAPRASGLYPDLLKQQITAYEQLNSDGTGGYRSATRNPVDYRLTATGPGYLGWYLELQCTGCTDTTAMDGERVTATPQGILSNVVFNTFRPQGDTCQPGSLNATMVLDSLTGAADYIPIPPPGGYPSGEEPPAGPLVGTDTVLGPPPGEPPIVIIRPPNPGVPCLPGSDGCADEDNGDTNGDGVCDPITEPDCNLPCDPSDSTCEAPVTQCAWRSPNSAGRPPGKAIPCGRISWKQIR